MRFVFLLAAAALAGCGTGADCGWSAASEVAIDGGANCFDAHIVDYWGDKPACTSPALWIHNRCDRDAAPLVFASAVVGDAQPASIETGETAIVVVKEDLGVATSDGSKAFSIPATQRDREFRFRFTLAK